MTRLLLIFILPITLASCVSTNVLTYKHRKHFKERNIITSDSIFTLYQDASYNRPNIVDEEFSYYLDLTFLDTTVAKTKRILNLATDTTIVKGHYGISSVWSWGGDSTKVSGQIEIIHWGNDGITIKENVHTKDFRRKQAKRFKGTITFTKQKGW